MHSKKEMINLHLWIKENSWNAQYSQIEKYIDGRSFLPTLTFSSIT